MQHVIISTGHDRFETNWKNHKINWQTLVDKLTVTTRTREKMAEFLALSPSRQDAIKDVGGFVGGYIDGGRRLNTAIKYRTIMTLDIDHADSHFWQDFTLLFDFDAVLYSTHKHRPEKPRLRLIMPLSRNVNPDEYEAIARQIADSVGMEDFDHTTFQASRLMYWPSTCSDGEYLFKEQKAGKWFDVDQALAGYKDWKDSSSWPLHPSESRERKRSKDKQGDPREKPGLVGAFCSCYGIEGAIESFLSDRYEKSDLGGRYTFVGGSTSGGLVLYDDLFAFSHHSTDPVSGKLCNAFDLVRLHLFGGMDLDCDAGTPVNRMPSFTAMQDMASKDVQVRKWMGAQRQREATEIFGADEEEQATEGAQDDEDWMEQLDTDRKGHPHETIDNILIILRHDKRLRGRLAYDVFNRREIIRKNLPWRKIKDSPWWYDQDDAGLRHYLERIYEITSIQKIKDALEMIFVENSFHPVRDYLNGLQWDGQHRLDELFIDYMGAEDSLYARAVCRKFFTAAVARVRNPGCKFDYVPVLVGDQGIGKSTLLSKMGGAWFSDSFMGVSTDSNKAFEQLQGTWIMEMPELAGLKKAESEAIKHYISKQEDRYRAAYKHRVEYHPRQTVFGATSNELDGFLKDDTGERRFWPVKCGVSPAIYSVFDDLNPQEVGQLWAEATHYYEAGEVLHLGELEPEARKKQNEFKVQDDRVEVIAAYLEMPLPEAWTDMSIASRQLYVKDEEQYKDGTITRNKVCAAEIWCELFGGSFKDMTSHNTKHVHSLLKRVGGWIHSEKSARFKLYGKQKIYVRE